MADEILLNEAEYTVWQTVHDHPFIELNALAKIKDIDQAQVSAAATKAHQRGFIHIEERDRVKLVVSDGAEQLLAERLPERRAAMRLQREASGLPVDQFIQWCNAEKLAVNDVFKWGGAKGWIERSKTDGGGLAVRITDVGRSTLDSPTIDEMALEVAIKVGGWTHIDEPTYTPSETAQIVELLGKRPELAKIKKSTDRLLSLTPSGKTAFINARKVIERNTLAPEDLESGAWKDPNFKLRPFDVTLAARDVYPAKIHPLRKIIEQTRTAFLEMGFAEVVSPMVESAFWNFDALFQPQDHPARDMQDTFYMRDPATAPLPGEKGDKPPRKKRLIPFFARPEIVDQVRRTHEDGWETGSEGWGYTWSPERSRQVVLRTHTTAATIRALAANPNPPGKFFCVGWTYRNETISFKHLPVFHQVDGIILDEEANLASLLGTLQEFYTKMGFGRVKFKPAFYPYTEPSVDVVVYMESRKKWLEMGGAGIFRPEVTLPLGCKWPVLAWGLGIERLAMLRFGLSDIRDLYRANLDALEEVPLCR
jgi:phenylalanyl-tRNA synthetase alpha chain